MRHQRLVASGLHRNSAHLERHAALASPSDAICGHRQKPRPCPACRTRSVTIDRECFTQARTSRLEPGHSVGKEPVGEPSLSGEPECLSLHLSILSGSAQSGKQDKKGVALPPLAQAQRSPCRNHHEHGCHTCTVSSLAEAIYCPSYDQATVRTHLV